MVNKLMFNKLRKYFFDKGIDKETLQSFDELFKRDSKGFVGYKVFGLFYPAPEAWKIEKGSKLVDINDFDHNEDYACSYGIYMGTPQFIKGNIGNSRDQTIWKVRINKDQLLKGTALSFPDKEKARANELELLSSMTYTDFKSKFFKIEQQECHSCGTDLESDDYLSYDDEIYCEDCYHETFRYCDSCQEYSYSDNVNYCECCGHNYCDDCSNYTEVNYEWICEDCFDNNYMNCDSCENVIERDSSLEYDIDELEILNYDYENICSQCYDKLEEEYSEKLEEIEEEKSE